MLHITLAGQIIFLNEKIIFSPGVDQRSGVNQHFRMLEDHFLCVFFCTFFPCVTEKDGKTCKNAEKIISRAKTKSQNTVKPSQSKNLKLLMSNKDMICM